MKNRKFNFKLYVDGIKQLKLIGIMSTVILSVFSILIPIGHRISSIYRDESGKMIFSPLVVSLPQTTPVNYAIYLLIVPVMCLFLFNLLTKRNASDFYHSIPIKREGLYLSFYASIMTWIIGMLTLSSVLAVLIVAIMPNMSIIVSSIFIFYLKIFAASILVSGGFMIAISLTGTTFTNLIVAVILLFFPRIFIAATSLMINGSLPYINLSSNGLLLNYHNNLLISTFTELFNSSSYNSIWGPIVYSLILGILYVIIGCFLFVKRKSETAGNAAVNKGLQLIFRLSVSFIICLIPCYSIYSIIIERTNIGDLSFSSLFFIFVLYVIALFAYFLYELITTKKLKNLAKALPGVGILVLLNIVFIAFLSISTIVIKNTLPDANDIKYFNICPETYYYYDENNYFSELSSEIKITDETAIENVSELLKSTAEKCDENPNYMYYGNYTTMNIRIKTGLFKRDYTIALTENEYNNLIGYLKNNKDYMNLYTNLPSLNDNYTTVSMYRELPQEIYNQLYESARNEIAEMDFETAYNYIGNHYAESVDTITVTATVGIKQYSFNLPVSKTLPETYALYIAEYNKLNDLQAIIDIMNDWASNSIIKDYGTSEIIYFSEDLNLNFDKLDLYLYQCYSGGIYEDNFEIDEMPDEEYLELISNLAKHISPADENTDVTNTDILTINYNAYVSTQSLSYDADEYYTGYFTVDSEGLEILRQLAVLQGYDIEGYDVEVY